MNSPWETPEPSGPVHTITENEPQIVIPASNGAVATAPALDEPAPALSGAAAPENGAVAAAPAAALENGSVAAASAPPENGAVAVAPAPMPEPVPATVSAAPPAPVSAPAPPAPAAVDNVDKIRDILFGSQMRDYESRFSRLEQNLLREATEIREATRTRLDSLESFIKHEIESLTSRFKVERDERTGAVSTLVGDLRALNETLARKIADVEDSASSTHHELRDQLLQHGRDINEHIQAKHREASALVEQRYQELHNGKTDRAALASLFSELALRLNNEFHVPGSEH